MPFNIHDDEKFFKDLDKIVRRVYARRYGKQFLPQKEHYLSAINKKSDREDNNKGPEVDASSVDGYLMVDFESFRNKCIGDQLITKMRLLNFKDESCLNAYVQKTFENILQKEIYEMIPGLETRKKQIHRILKPLCLDICRTNCRCWKLSEFKDITIAPASLEKMEEISFRFEPPPMTIPRPNSKRGPSIKDSAMRNYLVRILQNCGGIVRINDMINFVRLKYNITTIWRVKPALVNRDEKSDFSQVTEDDLLSKFYQIDNFLLNPDNILMAKDLMEKMDETKKLIIYYRFAEEKKQEEIASLLGCSTSRISNIEKEIQNMYVSYFSGDDALASAEVDAVNQIIAWMIMREKDNE